MLARRVPAWLLGVLSALAGFLLAMLLGFLGVRPIGWAAVAGVALAVTAALTLAERVSGVEPKTALGVVVTSLVIEWPILALLYAWIRYEVS
jgi:predicted exporter